LGYDAGNPFPNNTLTTNAAGTAMAPADWKAALPVTVQAPGFITTTIPVAMPGMLTIQLTPQESGNEIEIKGTTSGFGTMVDNGKVQFGLVIPAVSRQQMLAFDMSTVMSPQTDVISVLGQNIEIPSNLTLPKQTVTYIFPITLDKPDYRTYVRSSGDYLMTATHGNFPLSKVISDMKAGKSIFEMINYFTFAEGGTRQVQVSGNTVGQDLTVNQTQFTNSLDVTAPAFPSNQAMISLALNEQANGLMVPTDLKRIMPGQSMALKSTGSKPNVLSLLIIDSKAGKTLVEKAMDRLSPMGVMNPGSDFPIPTGKLFPAQSFQQLSFSLLPATTGVAPTFMSLIDPPTIDAQNVLKMNAPANVPPGLTPVATYMVLTEIQSFGSGSAGVQSEQRTRLWEVWSSAWLNQVELPKISFPRNPNRKYRWEVMFLAQPSSVSSGTSRVNGVDLHAVTHVTRNTLEF
jgi:hypothetical protein